MTNGSFSISARYEAARVRLTVWGELDRDTIPVLEEELSRARTAGTDVILDLSYVEFIDGRGVRTVLDHAEHSRMNGWRFVVADHASPQVMRMFDLLGLQFPP